MPATITVLLPPDAELFFDGDPTDKKGGERTFSSPLLRPGMRYHYDLLARWKENGKTVERTRSVPITAGAAVRVSFLEGKPKADPAPEKGKDQEVVTSKSTKKRGRASSINFRKAFGLPLDTLATLGSRIDSARRKPDPVALAHAANELAVAEKVSKKKAGLTSRALLAEAAELAQLRKQSAELKAIYQLKQQIADEETNAAYWNTQIGLADEIAKKERDSIRTNELPGDTPRRILLNNYTTQTIDLWVNGNYKMQVAPGSSKWCVVEHKWNPTVLTIYGSDDDAVWGPRNVFGTYQTYTWNLE